MDQDRHSIRQIASNRLVTTNGSNLTLYVVRLSNGYVTDLFPLQEEISQTEWLPGTISLHKDDDGRVRAYYQGKLLT